MAWWLGVVGLPSSVIYSHLHTSAPIRTRYPSSSPYVTSVGGVFNGNLGSEPLQVDTISTGGFSSLGANPSQPWQVHALRLVPPAHPAS